MLYKRECYLENSNRCCLAAVAAPVVAPEPAKEGKTGDRDRLAGVGRVRLEAGCQVAADKGVLPSCQEAGGEGLRWAEWVGGSLNQLRCSLK